MEDILTRSIDNKQDIDVSVVIPAYNAGEFIARAIESVLAQTQPSDEIIVVDDGSTDNTAEVVKKYGSSINYIHQDNAGPGASRNTGIEAARCGWITFLDADDEWLPEYLAEQTGLLKRNSELAWTTTNFYQCLCSEDRRAAHIEPDEGQKALAGKEYFDDFLQNPLPRGCGCSDTILIRKDVLQQAGMFQSGQFISEDTDLWLRIAYIQPRVGYISEPLAIYHMDVSQSLSQRQRQPEFDRELIRRHLKLSAEYGRLDAFRSIAAKRVSSYIRSLLFEDRPEEIRRLMEEFGELLTVRFKTIVRLLLISPKATAVVCHMISKIVRALGLRKRIIRRPGRPEKELPD